MTLVSYVRAGVSGATSATFQVSTSIVLVSNSAAISASYNGTTQTETLAVTF